VRVTESRLDRVARGLANGMSRREALRAGGVAFAGAVAMSPADALAKLTGRCPKHHAHCDGKCCPVGEVCLPPKHKGGKRRCGCAHGGTRCGDKCVNVHADPHNCGHCGHKCAAGETCSNGQCKSTPPQCVTGETVCSGACVNLQTNPQHCGSCGVACGSTQVCSSGACMSECQTGETECGGGCVNLMTDPNNCNTCGHACPTGATCVGGQCQCPSGMAVCGGACVNQMTDAGACGANCVNCNGLPFVENVSCSSGTCMYTCAPDWQNCSGNAADGCPCLGESMSAACNGNGTCKQT
jgi:Stigma-specific protein, Stig1